MLPAGLQVDTFAGSAWVGLVPFEIHNLRGIPHFPETNVRTYIVGPEGSRAVWFFSLDATRLLAVIGARIAYHLPYTWSKMCVTVENGSIFYSSRRKWSGATSNIAVRPGDTFEPERLGELDHFLTARYRLYSTIHGLLGCAQIEREPWPLARAALMSLNQNLIEAAGLPSPGGAPLVHYCERLDVTIGRFNLGQRPQFNANSRCCC